jgi:hypothetical protein
MTISSSLTGTGLFADAVPGFGALARRVTHAVSIAHARMSANPNPHPAGKATDVNHLMQSHVLRVAGRCIN